MPQHLYIEAFGLAGFRSFGDELQRIGPCSKLNLLVGQNNSGKSNVLRFLSEHYRDAQHSARTQQIAWKLEGLNLPVRGTRAPVIAFGLQLGGEQLSKWTADAHDNPGRREVLNLVGQVLRSEAVSGGTDVAYFSYSKDPNQSSLRIHKGQVKQISDEEVLTPRQWNRLWHALTNQTGGDKDEHWIPESLHRLALIHEAIPNVSIIPAIRTITKGNDGSGELSGAGLIDRLARLQNPSLHERESLKKFHEISSFVREVVGNPSARLEIPHERDMILIEMDGVLLPLDHLGTGIHEVVILAAAATVISGQVLCIEEPEIHLHPTLQRKLIRYLQEHTENQYFVSTHSAHLLDTPDASVFHIRHSQTGSVIDGAYTQKRKAEVCADLGYRASDLLQANAVIWVEGPSDRIYLSHWLRSVDAQLVEGLHYSVMFYGGRLLSHLTANDPEITEFISLRRLNRYIAVLMDSDRSIPRGRINETKRRLKREFDAGPGFAWITAGREIENYVPVDILQEAVKSVHQEATGLVATGPFDHALTFATAAGKHVTRVDKVKVAHRVTEAPADLTILDLGEKIRKLAVFIRSANDTIPV